MAKVTQYSRISHHTLAGSASATFSVPPSEDFTDGSWSIYDLALSEIGVNEDSKKAYIRINDEVKEFEFVGGTAGDDLQSTLSIGNTTGANDIIVDVDRQIKSTDTAYIQFGDSGAPDLNSIVANNGGDGVTIPANSFGFSGTDPLFTAQVVDIGGITDTLSLAPTGLGALGSSGIRSEDASVRADFGISTTGIQLNVTDLPSSTKIHNISVNSPGISNGVQLSASNLTTSDVGQIDISDTNVGIFSSDAAGQKVDNLYIDPQGITSNETGIKSTNQVSLDNVYVSVNSSTMIGRLFVDETSTGVQSSVIVDSLQAKIQSTDGGSSNQAVIVDNVGKQINLSTQTWNDIGNGKITMSSNGIISNNISFERASTANNTITTIHTFQCVNSGPKSYKVRVTGVKTDYTKAYLSEMFGLYLFDGATVTLVGTLDKVEKTNFSTATSTISISGTTIRVRVTGEAATNIDWEVYVEMNTTD